VQLIAGDAIVTEDYGLIAGEAAEGTLFTAFRDARSLPRAAEMVADYRAENNLEWPEGAVLLAYAAVQAWVQAVEQAGSPELESVIGSLRTSEFDTVLGTIGFDDKGDTTGYEPFAWYVWRSGTYEPVDPAELTD
jgi:branched-chain amino acid transport system substrate-binding protein